MNKECPLRMLAFWSAPSDVLPAMEENEFVLCVQDRCAWWVDDYRYNEDGYQEGAHHCGLIGRVWGWDDRREE